MDLDAFPARNTKKASIVLILLFLRFGNSMTVQIGFVGMLRCVFVFRALGDGDGKSSRYSLNRPVVNSPYSVRTCRPWRGP